MKVSVLLFCALISFASFSQNATLSGKITDNETKEALIGATIIVEKTTLGGITDLDGKFTIKNIPAGAYQIRIKYIGYEDVVESVSLEVGQNKDLGELTLTSNAIGLNEIEVFANVVEDRKTPVAVANLGSIEIAEQLGAMQLPELLNSTPGIYATQGDGAFGDAYVNIRGFGQEEVLFMINGVPMNDMENGIMYWSNFAGLSEVTRNMQVQRGLGASKLAVNSVGGTMNIVTDPSERRKGGRAEVIFGNGSFRNRYRFTLHSGELKGGWSVSFQGSRSNGEGIRPGTFVDAWSYFLTVSKEINDKHTLLFTTFGAPANRGRAFNTNTKAYEQYDNYLHNPSIGYYNGELYNSSQNYAHKPQITLMHLWNVSDKLSVTTSAYASIARVYGTVATGVTTNQSNLNDPNDDITNEGLIDFEKLKGENLANIQTVTNPFGMFGQSITGAQSRNIIEARYNNHNWYGIITNANYQINTSTNLVFGLDLRDYRAGHYAKVHDLLGGSFYLDRFSNFDNNLLTPNRVAFKGDKIRYDYDGKVRWGSLFAQVEKTINQFDIFISANTSRIQMSRVGNMWSGDPEYITNSLGESDVRVFNNYNAKAGVNYRITGRHNVFVNGGRFTRAPFLRNAFIDSRYGNEYLDGLKNETIHSAELGYSYRTSRLRVNFNAYYTEWKDRVLSNDAFIDERTGRRQALNGIAALHKGLELDARFEVIPGLEITAMASTGDWRWKNNVQLISTDDQGTEVVVQSVNVKNLKVGNSAQTTAFIGMHFKRSRNSYFGFRYNYFADLYESFDPAQRTSEVIKPVRKLPDYGILDIYAGYYFNFGEFRSRVSANVHNVLNDTFIRRSDEQFGVQEAYGFPINFNANFTVYFN
ncbi:MAG: TonB-dependent receptor [Flammeovirgaceae bacterium]|nr:TonB-dependent receptor [Flammeovirgaceae bacterium]